VLGLCGAFELAANRPMLHRARPGVWWALAVLVGVLAGWGLKVAMGFFSGRYPLP
jgi:hypothetical protein